MKGLVEQYSIKSLLRLFLPRNSSDPLGIPCRAGPSIPWVIDRNVPRWDDVLNIYNLTSVKEASAITDLQHSEVIAGSYFFVAGALVGILKPGRKSMFWTLLVIWGLIKDGILGKPGNTDPSQSVSVYPTMLAAVLCAFSSINNDVKKVHRVAPA